MRNMRLSEIRRKKDTYFKKIGILTPRGRRKSSIEYIVARSYEALPKKYKSFIESPDQIIKVLTNMIVQSGEKGQINPYKALLENAKYKYRSSYAGTKEDIYKRFRQEYSDVYNHYNTYVYRLGFSASNYFYTNVKLSQEGSIVTATLQLPKKTTGIVYNELYIEMDYSGDYFFAEMT